MAIVIGAPCSHLKQMLQYYLAYHQEDVITRRTKFYSGKGWKPEPNILEGLWVALIISTKSPLDPNPESSDYRQGGLTKAA